MSAFAPIFIYTQSFRLHQTLPIKGKQYQVFMSEDEKW